MNSIDNLDSIFEILNKILTENLNCDFKSAAAELNNSENLKNLKLPCITYNIKSRKASTKSSLKDITKEIVDGKETGFALKVYSQWFNCIVEFNIFGRTSQETIKLTEKFETLIDAYSSDLKYQGIKDISFLAEYNCEDKKDYTVDIPKKCLDYYIGFERLESFRINTFKNLYSYAIPLNNTKILNTSSKGES
ncbi:hypothetical protein [Clostridium felsineum]|uniref:hypothetical protein n=1 Tax=Clostridium felsineum TaxID=36839 RepID=UPI00098CEC4C|nr:hypothetical protein [Clostridium felsineum]URZ18508.1 hypothetical protein CLFE_045960 [Clostridium felsineum DSM 794]